MTEHSPITPPPDLVRQWEEDWHHSKVKHVELEPYIAAQAAQWGADQELEACCEWLDYNCPSVGAHHLRTARRPNPPSLKEQALSELYLTEDSNGAELSKTQVELIRRALEALPDD